MLILDRKTNEAVVIDLIEGLDPRTPVGELFAAGPIEIVVRRHRQHIKVGIRADVRFLILRMELYQRRHACALRGGVR